MHALVKGSIGAIPFAGSIASEFFSLLISPPLQIRMDKWFNDLYAEIEILKKTQEAYKSENLEKNEKFISALTSATQTVIKTHYDEKIKALKNAVINSVVERDFKHGIYFNILDSITPNHILILKMYFEQSGYNGVDSLYEECRNNGHVFKNEDYYLLVDLESKGLIEKDFSVTNNNSKAPPSGKFYVKISPFGTSFYKFITR